MDCRIRQSMPAATDRVTRPNREGKRHLEANGSDVPEHGGKRVRSHQSSEGTEARFTIRRHRPPVREKSYSMFTICARRYFAASTCRTRDDLRGDTFVIAGRCTAIVGPVLRRAFVRLASICRNEVIGRPILALGRQWAPILTNNAGQSRACAATFRQVLVERGASRPVRVTGAARRFDQALSRRSFQYSVPKSRDRQNSEATVFTAISRTPRPRRCRRDMRAPEAGAGFSEVEILRRRT
jgi:hypothetical protein